jgi:DNA-binding response OmpR family regulator
MEMGADDFLTKPFDDMELLHAIETRIISGFNPVKQKIRQKIK